ncbi:MAG: hypothetical protein LBS61_02995 [Endomicrobium sp.]|jgi:hypothetical protein|nr:hypothetical protein [Endomicrobium sp.]
MKNLNLVKIAKNNEYIDIEKIEEVMKYIKEMEPFIEKKGYDIGEPELNENTQILISFSKNNNGLF